MTASRTTERGGSSELKDELEVIEEIDDGQQVMHYWQESKNLRIHGQNCYLMQTSSRQQQLQNLVTNSQRRTCVKHHKQRQR